MNTTQELELVSYIKERVKFEGKYCGENCRKYGITCILFDDELESVADKSTDWFTKFIRCDLCKKFFD